MYFTLIFLQTFGQILAESFKTAKLCHHKFNLVINPIHHNARPLMLLFQLA